MNKTLLILALTALTACSSTEPAADRFTVIAEEWQGGHIQDMIHVWGDPKTLKQAGTDGEDGVARWQHISGGGAPSTGVAADDLVVRQRRILMRTALFRMLT